MSPGRMSTLQSRWAWPQPASSPGSTPRTTWARNSVGAVLAALATWMTFGGAGARSEAKLAATYPAQGVGDLQAFVVEILITFILVFVVMAVATDQRAPAAIAPIAVGFALAVGVFIAGPVSGGSVNPARSLGPMIVAGDLSSVW